MKYENLWENLDYLEKECRYVKRMVQELIKKENDKSQMPHLQKYGNGNRRRVYIYSDSEVK